MYDATLTHWLTGEVSKVGWVEGGGGGGGDQKIAALLEKSRRKLKFQQIFADGVE